MPKRVAMLVEIDGTERLDELKTPYEPAVRDVPDDEDIGAFLGVTPDDDTWAWATWALVTYGCRPSEVFSLRPEPNGTAQVLTIKQKGKTPKWRTALELPVSYPRDEDDNFSPPLISPKYDPRFYPRSVPWEVNSPSEYDSATAKLHTDRWAGWLRRRHRTFQLYDFRHAWAIRSIKKNLNASLAAKCMGHDVTTHHRAYHRWLDQSDIAAVAATLQQ